ncbi:unnamed protein product [Prunus armeniaca]
MLFWQLDRYSVCQKRRMEKMVNSARDCWKRPHFIGAGNHPFPRNPNGFYPFWLSFSLPFSSPPLAFPILVKFPVAVSVTDFHAQPFLLLLYSLFSMAKSDGKRSWEIYAGSKGVSGSSHTNILWFLECFLLGTCSPHVWNLQRLCLMNLQTFSTWLLFFQQRAEAFVGLL